ncbi:UPF0764 protein C16orf89 homolog isoform X1 [Panulirus ornatus]|uniref:UPF0764 protein C16orf89 homolog isoform X1 n=1 Tax=Panulirus ornatus TaxID=150431 RepID=UPI003A8A9EBE
MMKCVSGGGVLLLLVAVCGPQLALVSPAAALSRSGHVESPYPGWSTVPHESKTLVDSANEMRPPPLTVDETLTLQPDTDNLLTTDTDSVLTTDTDSVLTTDTDSVLTTDTDSVLATDTENPLTTDTDSVLTADTDSVLTTDTDNLLATDTDSVLATDTDSVLTPEIDSLLKRNVDDLLEADMAGLGERSVDGWPEVDTDALLRQVGRVVEACHRLLHYYTAHVTQMNFDAVVGTRIAEAHFRMVVRALEEGVVVAGVQSLLQEAQDVSNVARLVIMEADPDYPHRLGAILAAGFWEAPLTPRSLNTTRLSPPHDPRPVLSGEEQMEEGQSDECLEEVLGGGLEGAADGRRESAGRGGGRCSVSRVCWQRMTAPGYSGYSLTHQGFIFIVGIQAGCGPQLEQVLAATGVGKSLEGHLRKLCAAMLVEAVAIAQADFPENRRDLFMEQGAFCGHLGYHDFFRREWVARVLSWQRHLGCFGDAHVYAGHHPHPLDSHPRVRREERAMGGRCLAHRSSVALGYLSICLRLLTLM